MTYTKNARPDQPHVIVFAEQGTNRLVPCVSNHDGLDDRHAIYATRDEAESRLPEWQAGGSVIYFAVPAQILFDIVEAPKFLLKPVRG